MIVDQAQGPYGAYFGPWFWRIYGYVPLHTIAISIILLFPKIIYRFSIPMLCMYQLYMALFNFAMSNEETLEFEEVEFL